MMAVSFNWKIGSHLQNAKLPIAKHNQYGRFVWNCNSINQHESDVTVLLFVALVFVVLIAFYSV